MKKIMIIIIVDVGLQSGSSPLSLLKWALCSVSMRGNTSLDGHLNAKNPQKKQME